MPIPVITRSNAWVCSRSLAGIAGSNPAGVLMSFSCECCVLSEVSVSAWSPVQRSSAECGVSECDCEALWYSKSDVFSRVSERVLEYVGISFSEKLGAPTFRVIQEAWAFLCVIGSCIILCRYRRFERTCGLHLQYNKHKWFSSGTWDYWLHYIGNNFQLSLCRHL
jgi:hypothetical protein